MLNFVKFHPQKIQGVDGQEEGSDKKGADGPVCNLRDRQYLFG